MTSHVISLETISNMAQIHEVSVELLGVGKELKA